MKVTTLRSEVDTKKLELMNDWSNNSVRTIRRRSRSLSLLRIDTNQSVAEEKHGNGIDQIVYTHGNDVFTDILPEGTELIGFETVLNTMENEENVVQQFPQENHNEITEMKKTLTELVEAQKVLTQDVEIMKMCSGRLESDIREIHSVQSQLRNDVNKQSRQMERIEKKMQEVNKKLLETGDVTTSLRNEIKEAKKGVADNWNHIQMSDTLMDQLSTTVRDNKKGVKMFCDLLTADSTRIGDAILPSVHQPEEIVVHGQPSTNRQKETLPREVQEQRMSTDLQTRRNPSTTVNVLANRGSNLSSHQTNVSAEQVEVLEDDVRMYTERIRRILNKNMDKETPDHTIADLYQREKPVLETLVSST